MPRWEYLRVGWLNPATMIYVAPAEKLDVEWLRQLMQSYPRVQMKEGSKGGRTAISRLRTDFESVQIALFDHLGLEGWEAVNFRDGSQGGVAWFKRIVTE